MIETNNEVEGKETQSEPFRVRLPEFIIDEEVGLGDTIKRVTYTLGMHPCGGCQRRAATLNSWIVFSGPRNK